MIVQAFILISKFRVDPRSGKPKFCPFGTTPYLNLKEVEFCYVFLKPADLAFMCYPELPLFHMWKKVLRREVKAGYNAM